MGNHTVSSAVLFALLFPAAGVVCAETGPGAVAPDYVLGAGDDLMVRSIHVKELGEKRFRVERDGGVNLPMAGRIELRGMTVREAEQAMVKAFDRFYVEPDIAISVAEFRSQPVSVIGAVGKPGVHEALGQKSLLEMLALAGGVQADAGPVVKITRKAVYGPLPLPGAREAGAATTVAEVNLKSLIEADNPEENIIVRPEDVIAVPQAERVYVVGNVHKPGSIPLGGRDEISALEVLSLAGGLDPQASAGHTKILRASKNAPGSIDGREEVRVDLKGILGGRKPDLALRANDILFVPNSTAKTVTRRSLETALQVATGILIWRR